MTYSLFKQILIIILSTRSEPINTACVHPLADYFAPGVFHQFKQNLLLVVLNLVSLLLVTSNQINLFLLHSTGLRKWRIIN